MLKEKIKIKFIDFWEGFENEKDDFIILKILHKHFDVDICDDADYVFFSVMGEKHWYVPKNKIKIFYTGENLTPDFNACDYAIGFDNINFQDRYIRFPYYLIKRPEMVKLMERKHLISSNNELLKEKTNFCSFTVSNPLCNKRNQDYKNLSNYKKVESGGKLFNNIGNPVNNKFEFDKKHKFSLCYENTSHPGYITEKIIEAFAAQTIPIYWGDPEINKIFNDHAFINVNNYSSFDEVIDIVKQIDNDDNRYIEMIKTPALINENNAYEKELEKFEKWLLNIFIQPMEKAKRRDRGWYADYYINSRKKLRLFQYIKEFLNCKIKN